MRIVAFSDLHADGDAARALVAAGQGADLVIGAGDFAQHRKRLDECMGWLRPLDARSVYVPGNNESLDELRAATGATVVHGQTVLRGGLRIAGVGGGLADGIVHDWPSIDLTEAELTHMLDRIPACDILISHVPPRGACDRHSDLGRIGSTALAHAAQRLQPRFLFCGHIHDAWGQQAWIGETQVINLGPTPNRFEVTA